MCAPDPDSLYKYKVCIIFLLFNKKKTNHVYLNCGKFISLDCKDSNLFFLVLNRFLIYLAEQFNLNYRSLSRHYDIRKKGKKRKFRVEYIKQYYVVQLILFQFFFSSPFILPEYFTLILNILWHASLNEYVFKLLDDIEKKIICELRLNFFWWKLLDVETLTLNC
jgi:hypothetical protein